MSSAPNIESLEGQILNIEDHLTGLHRADPPQPVGDLSFRGESRDYRLSDLFGRKSDLILFHSRGVSCGFCAQVAEGLNLIVPDLERHGGFALVSSDPLDLLIPVARFQRWRFRAVSDPTHQSFTVAGLLNSNGEPAPGVSAYKKASDGSVVQVATARFEAGSGFSQVWRSLDLLLAH